MFFVLLHFPKGQSICFFNIVGCQNFWFSLEFLSLVQISDSDRNLWVVYPVHTSRPGLIQNSDIWATFWDLVKIQKFAQSSEIWSKFWCLVKIQKFCQNSVFYMEFWYFCKIQKFGQNSELWAKFRNLVKVLKLNNFF